MSDIVNIELAVPSPIRIAIGEDAYTISGYISFRDGLQTNRLLTERQRCWEVSQAIFREVQARRLEGASMEDVVKLADEAANGVIAFEEAGDALLAHIDYLLKDYDPKQSSERLSAEVIDRMASIIWARAMGADDEALEAMGDREDGEQSGPPPKRSTSRNGSTASARPTAAARRTGSRSR